MIPVLYVPVYDYKNVIYKVLILMDHSAESPVNTDKLVQRMFLCTPAV